MDANGAGDRLADLAAALLDDPDVTFGTGRRGFGSGTLMVGGRIFAMVSDERLVLKLPASRVATLIGAGRGQPFGAGKPRPLREWVALGAEAGDWLDLGREALAFVRSRGGG